MNKYKMSNSQKVGEKGLLIILSSPSGAGKSTLAQRIKSWDENCVFSISATTRKPREGEQDGKDYYFISEDEFRKKVSNSDMLEHAFEIPIRAGLFVLIAKPLRIFRR